MAILEIKKYPDPILRKKCEEVKEITPEIQKLVKDMIETMRKNNGIGLAGPQVGILKRIIVVQTEKEPLVFINPKILKNKGPIEVIEEGCLSLPGLFLKIKRPKFVEVEALDINGKKIHWDVNNFFAKSMETPRYSAETILMNRVIQHEVDHLNGILIIDRISFWQRWRINKKFNYGTR